MIGPASGHGSNVSKALYRRDDKTSALRVGGAAAGLAVGAWGLGRSKMVGRALGIGSKFASFNGNPQAARALDLALATQGALRRGTAPAGTLGRRIQRVNAAVEAVPPSLRPTVAMTAGAVLFDQSTPVRRTTYTPATPRVRIRTTPPR